jgi:predicted ATPase
MKLINKKIIITGGPGTGKSSIITFLKDLGYHTFSEFSRSIISNAKLKGDRNIFFSKPETFSEKLFQGRKKQLMESELIKHNKIKPYIFFDRGLYDIYAYLKYAGLESIDFKNRIFKFKYDIVFLLYPWKKIYKIDLERMETFLESKIIHKEIKSVYKESKILIIKVPYDTIKNRVNFILNQIKLNE